MQAYVRNKAPEEKMKEGKGNYEMKTDVFK